MSLSSLIVQREIATIREVEEALARQVLYGGDLVTNLLEVSRLEEQDLLPVFLSLVQWGDKHLQNGQGPLKFVAAKTGRHVGVRVTDDPDGGPLFITSAPEALPASPTIAATEVKATLLRHIFGA